MLVEMGRFTPTVAIPPMAGKHHSMTEEQHPTAVEHCPKGGEHHSTAEEHHPTTGEHRPTAVEHCPMGGEHHLMAGVLGSIKRREGVEDHHLPLSAF